LVGRDKAVTSSRQRDREIPRNRWWQHGALKHRVLFQDQTLEPLESTAGFQAQLVAQSSAHLAVQRQRVGLTPGAVQREHQLAAQPLLQRLTGDQPFELCDQLSARAERKVGVGALHHSQRSQLPETADLALDLLNHGQVTQRRPTPQRQRIAQLPHRARRIPGGQHRTPIAQQPLKPRGVKLL